MISGLHDKPFNSWSKVSRLVLMLGALIAIGRGAHAQATGTIVETASLPVGTGTTGTTTIYGVSDPFTYGTYTLSVAQYNPAAHANGALQTVSVNWSITTTIMYSYKNIGGTTSNITAASNSAITYLYQPGSSTQYVATAVGTAAPFSVPQSIASGQTISGTSTPSASDTTYIPGSNTKYGHYWSTADQLVYTGTGNATFNVKGLVSNTYTDSAGNSTITPTITTYVKGTVTVTYTYYIFPEPGTWALMFSGVFTGLYVRKRRAKSEVLG